MVITSAQQLAFEDLSDSIEYKLARLKEIQELAAAALLIDVAPEGRYNAKMVKLTAAKDELDRILAQINIKRISGSRGTDPCCW